MTTNIPVGRIRNKAAIERLKHVVDACIRDKHALEEYEHRYQALVGNTMTGVFVHDGNRFIYINKQFSRLFNVSCLELDKLSIRELCANADAATVMLAGSGIEEVVEGKRADGSSIWLKISGAKLMCRDKEVVLGIVVDISDQVVQNQQLKISENQLHQLAAKLIDAHEVERKRISSELQEELAQRLSAIKFAIESIRHTINDDAHPDQSTHFTLVIDAIRESIEHVRRVSMELHPSLLDDFGLLATIDWYCREFALRYPHVAISRTLYVDESNIANDVKIPIFRIIQESFDNIIKHAAADKIELELLYNDGVMELLVHDNGRGMALPTMSVNKDEYGLTSLREHALIAHGKLSVISRRGHGTTISVKWNHSVN